MPVNLGTGKGVSVLDLLKGMEAATGKPIPYKIVPRRPGDVARCSDDSAATALTDFVDKTPHGRIMTYLTNRCVPWEAATATRASRRSTSAGRRLAGSRRCARTRGAGRAATRGAIGRRPSWSLLYLFFDVLRLGVCGISTGAHCFLPWLLGLSEAVFMFYVHLKS